MKIKSWNLDDAITEARTRRRLRQLEQREQTLHRARELSGEVVRYIPTGNGYLVVCGKDVLSELVDR